jgi:hypothetical protein
MPPRAVKFSFIIIGAKSRRAFPSIETQENLKAPKASPKGGNEVCAPTNRKNRNHPHKTRKEAHRGTL